MDFTSHSCTVPSETLEINLNDTQELKLDLTSGDMLATYSQVRDHQPQQHISEMCPKLPALARSNGKRIANLHNLASDLAMIVSSSELVQAVPIAVHEMVDDSSIVVL